MFELLVGILLMVVIRYAYRRFIKQIAPPTDPADRCTCGYVVDHLSVPRCPECGRVIGFTATAEELGLTEEELQRAQAAKDKRRKERSDG